MKESASASSRESASAFPLSRAVKRWLEDGRAEGHSAKTRADREDILRKFAWWIEQEEEAPATLDAMNPETVRRFLSYLREHRPEGRWGSKHAAAKKDLRPASIHRFYRELRTFSAWLTAEGLLEKSAIANVKPPRLPRDRIPPPADEEVIALVRMARETRAPERNTALIAVLIDTGMRAGEAAGMRVGDVDRGEGRLSVLGKGGKRREIALGASARRLLWHYLGLRRDLRPHDPLWIATAGRTPSAPMTTTGIYQVVADCAQRAGLGKIGPHDLRRFAAVSMLRSGMDVLTLQRVLGHESLSVLRIYTELAATDIESAHRRVSPADRLKLR